MSVFIYMFMIYKKFLFATDIVLHVPSNSEVCSGPWLLSLKHGALNSYKRMRRWLGPSGEEYSVRAWEI